jgi:hypothetical protein
LAPSPFAQTRDRRPRKSPGNSHTNEPQSHWPRRARLISCCKNAFARAVLAPCRKGERQIDKRPNTNMRQMEWLDNATSLRSHCCQSPWHPQLCCRPWAATISSASRPRRCSHSLRPCAERQIAQPKWLPKPRPLAATSTATSTHVHRVSMPQGACPLDAATCCCRSLLRATSSLVLSCSALAACAGAAAAVAAPLLSPALPALPAPPPLILLLLRAPSRAPNTAMSKGGQRGKTQQTDSRAWHDNPTRPKRDKMAHLSLLQPPESRQSALRRFRRRPLPRPVCGEKERLHHTSSVPTRMAQNEQDTERGTHSTNGWMLCVCLCTLFSERLPKHGPHRSMVLQS